MIGVGRAKGGRGRPGRLRWVLRGGRAASGFAVFAVLQPLPSVTSRGLQRGDPTARWRCLRARACSSVLQPPAPSHVPGVIIYILLRGPCQAWFPGFLQVDGAEEVAATKSEQSPDCQNMSHLFRRNPRVLRPIAGSPLSSIALSRDSTVLSRNLGDFSAGSRAEGRGLDAAVR